MKESRVLVVRGVDQNDREVVETIDVERRCGPCEMCDEPGRTCENPFCKEVDDEIVICVLCERCEDERRDDV